jgi:hypothetical protein
MTTFIICLFATLYITFTIGLAVNGYHEYKAMAYYNNATKSRIGYALGIIGIVLVWPLAVAFRLGRNL